VLRNTYAILYVYTHVTADDHEGKKIQLFCAIPIDLSTCSCRFTTKKKNKTLQLQAKFNINYLRRNIVYYKVELSTYPCNTSAAICHTNKRDVYFSLVSALSPDLCILIILYCTVFLFSLNIIHMIVDLSACNIF